MVVLVEVVLVQATMSQSIQVEVLVEVVLLLWLEEVVETLVPARVKGELARNLVPATVKGELARKVAWVGWMVGTRTCLPLSQ